MPALHSSLHEDRLLEGLPAQTSALLVGLEGSCDGGHQLDQDMVSREVCARIFHHDIKDPCTHRSHHGVSTGISITVCISCSCVLLRNALPLHCSDQQQQSQVCHCASSASEAMCQWHLAS